MEEINQIMQSYIDNQELAQAVLLVYQDNQMVYQNKWGYQSREDQSPVSYDSVFRIMSMSKVITALCVLKLAEEGKLDLNDPIEKFLPAFENQRVALEGQYVFTPENPLKMLEYLKDFSMDRIKTEKKKRSVTIRDLLSHSSGLEVFFKLRE